MGSGSFAFVRKALLDIGFTDISEADDGAKAWPMAQDAAAKGIPYGLIISDWNMPILKGIDFLRNVRKDPTIAKTPFVLLTAESEMTQVKEAVLAGVSGYLVKPFTPAALKEKLLGVWTNAQRAASATKAA